MAGFDECKFPTSLAMASLNDRLDLPGGPQMQDWEIELADGDRVSEFLQFYRTEALTPDEQYALVWLLLASYDEALNAGTASEKDWDDLRSILLNDKKTYQFIIDRWSLLDEPDYNLFSITPLMRTL